MIMKKVWLVLLATVLVFGLVVSCGGDDKKAAEEEETSGDDVGMEIPWKEGAVVVDENNIVTVGTGYAAFGVTLPASLGDSETVVVTYNCTLESGAAKVIIKQSTKTGSNLDDILGSTEKYPTLKTDGVGTLELPGSALATGSRTYFVLQLNTHENADGKFKIKIISSVKKE